MSMSKNRTLNPHAARLLASSTASVDFPTPPFMLENVVTIILPLTKPGGRIRPPNEPIPFRRTLRMIGKIKRAACKKREISQVALFKPPQKRLCGIPFQYPAHPFFRAKRRTSSVPSFCSDRPSDSRKKSRRQVSLAISANKYRDILCYNDEYISSY